VTKRKPKRDPGVLVQTVLPETLGRWTADQAKAEGVSVAAWVRRLLLREQAAQASTDQAWRIERFETHEKNVEKELTRLGHEHADLLRALAAFGLSRDFDALREAVDTILGPSLGERS
jgi:hypothetical protein